MDWKEFFRPTVGKVIVSILFLILTLYGDLFSPLKCGTACPSVVDRFIQTITNVQHIIFVLVIALILYFVSCSVVQMFKKFKKQQ